MRMGVDWWVGEFHSEQIHPKFMAKYVVMKDLWYSQDAMAVAG